MPDSPPVTKRSFAEAAGALVELSLLLSEEAPPEEELPPQPAREATIPRAKIKDKNFFMYNPSYLKNNMIRYTIWSSQTMCISYMIKFHFTRADSTFC